MRVLMFAALTAILAAAGVFAYTGLVTGEFNMSRHGWTALTLGVVFSLIVGCGLMTLSFYSARQGYDEPLELAKPTPKSWPD